MLTVFIGEDGAAAKSAIRCEVGKLFKLHPHSKYIEARDIQDVPLVLEALGEDALFGDPAIVILSEVLGADEQLLEGIPRMATGSHYVFAFERKAAKELRERVQRAGGKIIDVTGSAANTKKREDLPFELAGAIARKDKRAAWMEFLRLLHSGAPPEMLHGTIFWAAKLMLLAKDNLSTDAAKLGFSPGAFRLYQKLAGGWKREELLGMIERLVDMQHDAHQGGAPIEIQLERFILEIK